MTSERWKIVVLFLSIVAVVAVKIGRLAAWPEAATPGFIGITLADAVTTAVAIITAWFINGKAGSDEARISAGVLEELRKRGLTVVLVGALALGVLGAPGCAFFEKQPSQQQQLSKVQALANAAGKIEAAGYVAESAWAAIEVARTLGKIDSVTHDRLRAGFHASAVATLAAIDALKNMAKTGAARKEAVDAILKSIDTLLADPSLAPDSTATQVARGLLLSIKPILQQALALV